MHSTQEIEWLYQEHGAALVLFGTSMVGEHNVAQDAVHQVFLRLLESGDLARAKDQKAYDDAVADAAQTKANAVAATADSSATER